MPNVLGSVGRTGIGTVLAAVVAFQAVLTYDSLAEGAVATVAANLLWPYLAVVLFVGYVGDRFDVPSFNLVLWTGAVATVAVGYAIQPAPEKLAFGGLMALFALYYLLAVFRDVDGAEPTETGQ